MNKIKHPVMARKITRMMIHLRWSSRPPNDDHWGMVIRHLVTDGIRDIVDSIGWPTRSKVGGVASHAAAEIVGRLTHEQVFQWHCLLLMRAMQKEGPGEVERLDIACLDDIVTLEQFGVQMYGTQFVQVEDRCILRPISVPKLLNHRRAEMGMSPLDSSLINASVRYWAKVG